MGRNTAGPYCLRHEPPELLSGAFSPRPHHGCVGLPYPPPERIEVGRAPGPPVSTGFSLFLTRFSDEIMSSTGIAATGPRSAHRPSRLIERGRSRDAAGDEAHPQENGWGYHISSSATRAATWARTRLSIGRCGVMRRWKMATFRPSWGGCSQCSTVTGFLSTFAPMRQRASKADAPTFWGVGGLRDVSRRLLREDLVRHRLELSVNLSKELVFCKGILHAYLL